jgi:protein-S-isoprenylcysteine O-methyltransferase Ste14
MALQEEFESQGNFLFKYRTYLPLIVLVGGLVIFYYQKKNYTFNDLGQNYWVFSLIVGLIGLLIRIYTVGHTPANTSGRNTTGGQLADQLNQTGIYSLVRHPLYLGNFLMWLAIALLTANTTYIIGFILAYWLYYERIMYAEEQFLRGKFGKSYTDWAANVPAFIPKLSGFVTPKYPFSLKKVLKKEKNGIAALFGLFWVFEYIGFYAESGKTELQKTGWFWAFIISVVLYIILKIIKSNTKILDEEGR